MSSRGLLAEEGAGLRALVRRCAEFDGDRLDAFRIATAVHDFVAAILLDNKEAPLDARELLTIGEQQLTILADDGSLSAQLARSGPTSIGIFGGELTCTFDYDATGTPTQVRVARKDRVVSFAFEEARPPAGELTDADELPVTLDHVGGASVLAPWSPREPTMPARPDSQAANVARDLLDAQSLLVELDTLRSICSRLPDADGAPAAIEQISAALASMSRAGPLANAQPGPVISESSWIGQRIGDQVIFIGPTLYVLAQDDRSTCTIVSGDISWELSTLASGTRVAVTHEDVHRDWTITPDGELIDNLAPAWRPTHTVGAQALEVGGVPSGMLAPGTVLDPGLEVRVIETTADGWALVECSNTWQCYVAFNGLAEIGEGRD